MADSLHLLSAGAVQGLVKAVGESFEREHGAEIVARFGAVGAMKEALRAHAPCDVLIVTDAMARALQSEGRLAAGALWPIGTVRTGVAVCRGAVLPDVSTPEALRAALLAASAIYFPDPERATAGIHFASVLARLGIAEAVAPRVRTFPNGATSMREMASAAAPGAIGCTQITEIVHTPGVALVGPLPEAFELATTYTAGVASTSGARALAVAFAELLSGARTRSLRREVGFEAD